MTRLYGSVKKSPRISTSHPCVFKTPFLRETVDPQVKLLWPDAPFGNLRRIWRERHCAELNPYDSAWCPYRAEDCALSFLLGVQATVIAHPDRPAAYFRSVVHNSAMTRAERKPLARQERPGDTGGMGRGVETRWGLRRAETRPTAVSDVLGALDLRPRERRTPDGSSGSE